MFFVRLETFNIAGCCQGLIRDRSDRDLHKGQRLSASRMATMYKSLNGTPRDERCHLLTKFELDALAYFVLPVQKTTSWIV